MTSSNSRFDQDFARQIVTLVSIISTFAVNALSNVVPINGLTIGEISNLEFGGVMIIPANYAFAIWGLIYLGLFAFGAYQMRLAQRENPRLQRGGYWLAIACLIQIVWVFLFLNRSFWLSVVAMIGILLSLIRYYVPLGIGIEKVSRRDRWLIDVPISIYLGWISVATVVNVASALYSVNWTGWGISESAWTIIMLWVTTAIAAVIAIRRIDIPYTCVIIWAFVAIAVRQSDTIWIVVTAIATSVILALIVLVRKFTTNQTNKTQTNKTRQMSANKPEIE
ncbi:MAG TPA: tryptophan-rich sensory protein [Elainellaceae cyanobacterium]